MVSMSPIGSGGRLSSDGKEGCSSADDTDELDAGPAQWEHDLSQGESMCLIAFNDVVTIVHFLDDQKD